MSLRLQSSKNFNVFHTFVWATFFFLQVLGLHLCPHQSAREGQKSYLDSE